MPELPEVESIRRSLEQCLARLYVSSATLLRREYCESFNVHGTRRKTFSRDLLDGGTVASLKRHGKQLAMAAADGRVMCIHLGMSGQLLCFSDGVENAPRTHVHAQWTFTDYYNYKKIRLILRDARRFGGIWTYPSFDLLLRERWSRLGQDALSINPELLSRALSGSDRAIKAALLDQSVIAGIGNIYADESLFGAGIRPDRPATTLKPKEIARLAETIRHVLESAIMSGGTTLRDYVNPTGLPGSYQQQHLVYGRGGKHCIDCGTRLKAIQVAQRTTVYCANCQK